MVAHKGCKFQILWYLGIGNFFFPSGYLHFSGSRGNVRAARYTDWDGIQQVNPDLKYWRTGGTHLFNSRILPPSN